MSLRFLSSLAVCVFASGCGGPGPTPKRRAPSPVAQAQATHEFPPGAVPGQRTAASWRSASAAVAAFAEAYINWTAENVSGDMRWLAARSIGQARSAMQLAAAQTGADYELQRGGIANAGVVEAVAPLPGRRDRYVVVTREMTTATATTAYQGLGSAWHLAVATVSQLSAGRWVVRGWQPES